MKQKYEVAVPFCVYVVIEVDAESEKEAKEKGYEDAELMSFAGNGGTNKLIGVRGGDRHVEIGESIDGVDSFEITAELKVDGDSDA